MTADRRFAPRPKPHRTTQNTAVATSLCRQRRPARSAARMPLSVNGLQGATLDPSDLHPIKESVVSALAIGDHGHIALVMSELRVKDPAAWVEVEQLLASLRVFEHVPPRAPLPGGGSGPRALKIERHIHRFWAGGPMPEADVANLLAMQAVVAASTKSGSPWRQFLWTSGAVNAGAVVDPRLLASGINVVNADPLWASLHVHTRETRWAEEARTDLEQCKRFGRLVGLIAVGAYGGVYMDTDIGPGALNLCNHQLYHTDPAGEIGHHAPPFRGPRGHADVVGDATLGDSPRERVARFSDGAAPLVDSFFASRAGTETVVRELAARFEHDSLPSGRDRFARLFVPLDEGLSRCAPPQQRVTPWAADLAWVQ